VVTFWLAPLLGKARSEQPTTRRSPSNQSPCPEFSAGKAKSGPIVATDGPSSVI
jgi:hypothetical protein